MEEGKKFRRKYRDKEEREKLRFRVISKNAKWKKNEGGRNEKGEEKRKGLMRKD